MNRTVREYLINFARTSMFTTTLGNVNIVAADASFDMLENGMAEQVCYPFIWSIHARVCIHSHSFY